MDERFERNSSSEETKEITKLDENILEQVLDIWKSMYNNIFWQIAYKTDRKPWVDPRWLHQKTLNFVNQNDDLLRKHREHNFKDYYDTLFSDFQKYLTRFLEIFEDYGNFGWLTRDYRHSRMVRMLVEWIFKLNKEFNNLYKWLEKHNKFANGSIEQYSYSPGFGISDENHAYINTELMGRINRVYDKNMAKIREVWMVIYRPLLELVKKELETLIEENWEEGFKAWLNDSYIWNFIEVESGKNFSRSYSILNDKLRTLGEDLANIQDANNLEMKDLWDYLKIKRSDKRKYNIKGWENRIEDCINCIRRWKRE